MSPSLTYLNITASAIHYASFIALCVLLAPHFERGNIATYFFVPVLNETDQMDAKTFDPMSKSIFSVGAAILVECLWTASAHALYAYSSIRNGEDGFYLSQLSDGVSTYRWCEYALSASLIWAIMAIYSGIRDTISIVFIFLCTSAVMYTGYISEKSKRATFPIAVGFTILFVQIIMTGIQLGENTADIPDFVIPLFSVIVLLYCSFGIVRVVSAFAHENKPKLKSEVAYTILSLTVKLIYRFVLASRVFK